MFCCCHVVMLVLQLLQVNQKPKSHRLSQLLSQVSHEN